MRGYVPGMDELPFRWYHITFGTHNSWLPGDARGFRSRDHDIHSTGDHRHPPPPLEHEALRMYQRDKTTPAITLDEQARTQIGLSIISHFQLLRQRLLALAVASWHVHLLARMSADSCVVKSDIGRIKRTASLAVNETLPGRVWARGCGLAPIRDEAHQRHAYHYILAHRLEKAWVWSELENDENIKPE